MSGGTISTYTTGQVLTAAELNAALRDRPAGLLGKAQITSSLFTVSGDLTGLSIAVTVGSSRLIRVTGLAIMQCGGGTPGHVDFSIKEGATQLAIWRQSFAGANTHLTCAPSVILTPSAGAHTYKLNVGLAGTTADVVAAATNPAFIAVEDLGAA